MKKYRLKQWYPALPNHVKVGDIAKVTEYGDNGFNVFKIFFNDDEWHIVSKRELHPDFWELIEEEKYCNCPIPAQLPGGLLCFKCQQFIRKEQEPLFITEDKVEVFDRNTIVHIVRNDTLLKIKINADYFSKYGFEHKVFFYESNADEYILCNKRVFSYNDIEKFQSGGEGVWYDAKAIAKGRIEEL